MKYEILAAGPLEVAEAPRLAGIADYCCKQCRVVARPSSESNFEASPVQHNFLLALA